MTIHVAALAFLVPLASWVAAPATASEISASDHAVLTDLRERLTLSNADLAALGLSQAQAEVSLQALRSWYELNAGALRVARASRSDAEAALQSALTRMHQGDGDRGLETQITQLQALHTQRREAVRLLEEAASQAAVGGMPVSARSAWASAHEHRALPGLFAFTGDLSEADYAEVVAAVRARPRVSDDVAITMLPSAARALYERAATNQEACLVGVYRAHAAVFPPATSDEP